MEESVFLTSEQNTNQSQKKENSFLKSFKSPEESSQSEKVALILSSMISEEMTENFKSTAMPEITKELSHSKRLMNMSEEETSLESSDTEEEPTLKEIKKVNFLSLPLKLFN